MNVRTHTGSEQLDYGATATRMNGSWARRGWMVTTALLALTLMLNAFVSYAASRRAIDGLNRGQADLLGATLREMLAARGATSDAEVLGRFLRANEGHGLRYVALTGDSVQAGVSENANIRDAPPPSRDSLSGRMPLVAMHDVLRAYFPGPVSSGPASPPSYAVIEFRPTASVRLVQSARRSLALAITAAVVLSLAAWMFVRISMRYDDARLRLEQQRHLAALGEMSAVLAHEIRNPLAALKGHAQLALERLTDGSREHTCLEYVIESADRLEVLVADLLGFARTGPVDVTLADPVDLLRMAARDVFGEATIAVDSDDAPAEWPLDAVRVRQALVNLLDNARQSSPPNGSPVARVAREGNRLVFEIRDFGPGLPAGREARIFDPFFTTRTAGTGLGLAVASRVAEMHGGAITARNHSDGGAVFRLALSHPRT